MTDLFETAQDAEDVFYDAFEEGDLDKMMRAWADDEDIVCVLPMREQVLGLTGVRKGWEEVFAAKVEVEINIHHQHWIEIGEVAVHVVHEQLIFDGNRKQMPPPVVATNVYRKGDNGWRMIWHHVSPLAPPVPQVSMPPVAR